jgi:hypothetical protein
MSVRAYHLLQGKIPLMKEHVCMMSAADAIAEVLAQYSYPRYETPNVIDHKYDLVEGGPHADDSISLKSPNTSILPDRLLKTIAPVFIIRHPARMVNSWYRSVSEIYGATVTDREWPFTTSYQWSRKLFDCYKAYFQEKSEGDASWPLVVDGDELVNNTKEIMQALCDAIGIDESGIQYEWNTVEVTKTWVPVKQVNPAMVKLYESFGGSIARSTGVVRDEVRS